MKIILDFDGVICDSAFEAFRLMLSVNGKIENLWDDSLDGLYTKFSNIRPYVRPAWNYYYVCNEVFGEEPQRWEPSESALAFQADFFNTRRQAMADDPTRYSGLNPFFKEAAFLNKLGPFDILTNKNTETVQMLLSINNITNCVKITSMSDVLHKKKHDILNLVSEPFVFIDDNLETVQQAEKLTSGQIFLASWGYNYSSSGVRAINSLEEIKCIL